MVASRGSLVVERYANGLKNLRRHSHNLTSSSVSGGHRRIPEERDTQRLEDLLVESLLVCLPRSSGKLLININISICLSIYLCTHVLANNPPEDPWPFWCSKL